MEGTHRLEGGQGSYTPRVRTSDLERRELQSQSCDCGVDIALRSTNGFWQAKMREDEEAAGLVPRALVSRGRQSRLRLRGLDETSRRELGCGVGRTPSFPTLSSGGGQRLLGKLASWLPVRASHGGLCSLCSSLLLLKLTAFGFGPGKKSVTRMSQ